MLRVCGQSLPVIRGRHSCTADELHIHLNVHSLGINIKLCDPLQSFQTSLVWLIYLLSLPHSIALHHLNQCLTHPFTPACPNHSINCALVPSCSLAPPQPFQTKLYGAGFNEVLIMCRSECGSGTARCPPCRVQIGWNWLPCQWLIC